jgi:hypothetical protein
MNRHPANELNEDLALDRMYGESNWNPLERQPTVDHRLDRIGQMIPLPDRDNSQPPRQPPRMQSSNLGQAMRVYWVWVLGIALGAWIGAMYVGWIGGWLGAILGGWIAGRLFKNLKT